MGLEGISQCACAFGQGSTLVFCDLFFQCFEHFAHGFACLLAQGLALSRVHFGFGGLDLFGRFGRLNARDSILCRCDHLSHHIPTQTPDFIGPNGHGWQRNSGIVLGLLGEHQCSRKTLPDGLQLAGCRVQLGRELRVHTGPDGIGGQLLGLRLPLVHVTLQTGQRHLGFGHRFGREHFNALGQKDRCFTLHHHLVLQVFHAFEHFGQTNLQAGQRFA